jgi:hypothetical protein
VEADLLHLNGNLDSFTTSLLSMECNGGLRCRKGSTGRQHVQTSVNRRQVIADCKGITLWRVVCTRYRDLTSCPHW